MATKRTLTSVFFIAGLTAALLEIGCSIESVPAERRQQKEAAREEYERNQQAESAAAQRQRAEEFQRRIADPGSLSLQESDAEIEALRSPSSLRRIRAAEKLGDADGSGCLLGNCRCPVHYPRWPGCRCVCRSPVGAGDPRHCARACPKRDYRK
jgi:hypothetical protein